MPCHLRDFAITFCSSHMASATEAETDVPKVLCFKTCPPGADAE